MPKLLLISLKNHNHELLRGIIHLPKNYNPKTGTAIIYLHGFPGSMFGSAKRFLTPLAKLGFLCMRFEFSGTNTSAGKFENKLMSTEVKEIKLAINFLKKNYGVQKLILIGHSTGAIDAALYAHKDKRITKLILSGGVSDLKHAVRYDFTDLQVYQLWKQGYITYHRPKHWTHNKKLNKAFYDEFFTLNIPKALKQFHKPILILHGEQDQGVFVKEAHELYKIANKPKKLTIIKDADHSFTKPKHFAQALNAIYKFSK